MLSLYLLSFSLFKVYFINGNPLHLLLMRAMIINKSRMNYQIVMKKTIVCK